MEDKEVKSPNVFDRAKEEFEAIFHSKNEPNHHHQETHGLRNDIDKNTSINNVKGPNMFERAKEEIEALVQMIHPKKEDCKNYGSLANGETRF